MNSSLRHKSSLRGLRVQLLGTGRVASSLGPALAAVGADVTVSSARGRLGPVDADLILIAVTDSALSEVVRRLNPRLGQVVAHTSGRHGLAVLAQIRSAGAHALAFHPAMPFTGAPVHLAGASIGLTADPDALPLAERLCAALEANPVWIAEEQRDLYHAALCHSANHLVTLIADAARMLRKAGITDPSALLRPLTEVALRGALERGEAAMTGPVVRGDAETVAAHAAAIQRSVPSVGPSYGVLAQRTSELGILSGVLEREQAETIAAALQGVRA